MIIIIIIITITMIILFVFIIHKTDKKFYETDHTLYIRHKWL